MQHQFQCCGSHPWDTMAISKAVLSAVLSAAALILTTIVFLSAQLPESLLQVATNQAYVRERPTYLSNANESIGVGFDLTASYG